MNKSLYAPSLTKVLKRDAQPRGKTHGFYSKEVRKERDRKASAKRYAEKSNPDRKYTAHLEAIRWQIAAIEWIAQGENQTRTTKEVIEKFDGNFYAKLKSYIADGTLIRERGLIRLADIGGDE